MAMVSRAAEAHAMCKSPDDSVGDTLPVWAQYTLVAQMRVHQQILQAHLLMTPTLLADIESHVPAPVTSWSNANANAPAPVPPPVVAQSHPGSSHRKTNAVAVTEEEDIVPETLPPGWYTLLQDNSDLGYGSERVIRVDLPRVAWPFGAMTQPAQPHVRGTDVSLGLPLTHITSTSNSKHNDDDTRDWEVGAQMRKSGRGQKATATRIVAQVETRIGSSDYLRVVAVSTYLSCIAVCEGRSPDRLPRLIGHNGRDMYRLGSHVQQPGCVTSLAFLRDLQSPFKEYMVVGTDTGRVLFYHLDSHQRTQDKLIFFGQFSAAVSQLCVVAEGGGLLLIVGKNGLVEVWNIATGSQKRLVPPHQHPARKPLPCVVACGRTHQAVVALFPKLDVYDVARGVRTTSLFIDEALEKQVRHAGYLGAGFLGSRSDRLVCVCNGLLRVYHLVTKEWVASLSLSFSINGLVVLPSRKDVIVSGYEDGNRLCVRQYDMTTMRPTKEFLRGDGFVDKRVSRSCRIHAMALDPSAGLLVCAGSQLWLFDVGLHVALLQELASRGQLRHSIFTTDGLMKLVLSYLQPKTPNKMLKRGRT